MELDTSQIKELLEMLDTFTWPLVIVIVLFLFRDVVAHFLKTIIDVIFRR